MTSRISGSASTSNLRLDPVERARPTPRGLAATPDSIEMPPQAPKPSFIRRFSMAAGLLGFHILTWSIQLYSWILKTIFGYSSRQQVLYQELHHVAATGNVEKIEEFLLEQAEEATSAGVLFGELLLLPQLHAHLPEILKGANVCLSQDKGLFYRRWKEHPDAYRRISSHRYQGEECYAIGHFLFWLDLEGNSRFQFEKSPLRGFLSTVNHIIDYLRYKRDNEQQGVTGVSPFTESHCLTFNIDLEDYTIYQK